MSGMLWLIREDIDKSLELALIRFLAKYGMNPIRIEVNPIHTLTKIQNIQVVHNDRIQKTNAWLIIEEEEENGDITYGR